MPRRQLVYAGVTELPGAPSITSFLLNATAPKVFVLSIGSRNLQGDGRRFYAVAMAQRPGFVLKKPDTVQVARQANVAKRCSRSDKRARERAVHNLVFVRWF